MNILPHPGWVSWLETRHPLLLVWKDLAIKWVGRQLRVTRAQRDRHSDRWSRFESAMLMETCSNLRALAESRRLGRPKVFRPDQATKEFRRFARDLAKIGIDGPTRGWLKPGDANGVSGWREDCLTWLDQLHYARTIGSLRVAERAWRKVQRQQRRKVLLDAVPKSP